MSTSIEWTQRPGTKGESWNPVKGCTVITPGCARCYAKTFAERWRGVAGHAYEHGFDPREAPEHLGIPLHWRAPRTVFVNSMSDLFHDAFSDEYIAAVFGVMAACPQHTFILLTKREVRMVKWFKWVQTRLADQQRPLGAAPNTVRGCIDAAFTHLGSTLAVKEIVDPAWHAAENDPWPLRNVWVGVTVEDRARASRIAKLREVPAAVRFVSFEPLLEAMDIDLNLNGIDWTIIGGESGNGARLFDVSWAHELVHRSRIYGAAPFVKQLGAHSNAVNASAHDDFIPLGKKGQNMPAWPADLRVREWPEVRS